MYLEVLSASKFMSYFMCSYKIITCTSGVSSTQYFNLRYFVYHESNNGHRYHFSATVSLPFHALWMLMSILSGLFWWNTFQNILTVVTESMRAFQSRVCEDGQTAWICKINRFIGYVSVHTQYLRFFKTLLYARCNTHTILYNGD